MSGPAAKLTGSIFDPQQPFGPPPSSSSSSSPSGTDNNRLNDDNDDDDDLASLRPFVMDTAQAQGLRPLGSSGVDRGDGEPGMGSSYEAVSSMMSSSSMLPDIEMTTPLPVAVNVSYNDNDNDNSDAATSNTINVVNGNYGSGDGGGDYDMTAAFLPYKPPPSSSTTPPPMTSPSMASQSMSSPATKTATDARAVTAGTVLSAKVDLGLLAPLRLINIPKFIYRLLPTISITTFIHFLSLALQSIE